MYFVTEESLSGANPLSMVYRTKADRADRADRAAQSKITWYSSKAKHGSRDTSISKLNPLHLPASPERVQATKRSVCFTHPGR